MNTPATVSGGVRATAPQKSISPCGVLRSNTCAIRRGVHNLLYVYSPDIVSSQDNYLEFWPGDAYVDVLGLDAYDRSSWAIETNGLRLMRLLKHIAYLKNKPFAFTETGLENNTSQSKWWTEKLSKAIAGIPVAYVLVWRNKDTNHFFGPLSGLRFGGGFQDLRRRGADIAGGRT